MPDRVIVHREDVLTNNGYVNVEVIIKVSAIARALGGKAYRSKGKQAVEIGGLVTVKAPKR